MPSFLRYARRLLYFGLRFLRDAVDAGAIRHCAITLPLYFHYAAALFSVLPLTLRHMLRCRRHFTFHAPMPVFAEPRFRQFRC